MNYKNKEGMMEVRTLDTRERILDTAEHLFMTHGYEGTSMRQITSEASVNLAAVNYHFGRLCPTGRSGSQCHHQKPEK